MKIINYAGSKISASSRNSPFYFLIIISQRACTACTKNQEANTALKRPRNLRFGVKNVPNEAAGSSK